MKKIYNNSILQFLLIACLSVALLLGQAVKLHLHIQHDDISSSSVNVAHDSEHIVDIHVTSVLHDRASDAHHDDLPDHHNIVDIDISSDSILKISKILTSFVFLFLVVSFALSIPLLQRIRKTQITRISSPTKYYLLHAPLRAPPI